MDARGGEFAVQGKQRAQAAAAQIFGHRGRFQQYESELQILEAVIRQIDQAIGVEAEGIAVEIARQRRAALVQRGGHVDIQDRAEQRRGRPFEQPRHARRPAHLERAVVSGDAQARELAARKIGIEPSGPAIPCPLARDLDAQGFGKPSQRRDHAVAGSIQIERDVEAIVVRHRIEFERDPIAARPALPRDRRCVERDLRAPVRDIRPAADRGDAAFPADRRFGDEIVDPEFADVDIVIRQQRIVARRCFGEFGQALQSDARRDQRADVDMAAQEFERSPIDAHFGRGQEHALRVGDGDVVQDHLAIERAFDAPDIDLHAVLEFEPGDLVGDEALARPGIEPEDQRADQQDDAAQYDRGPFRDFATDMTLAMRRFRRFVRLSRFLDRDGFGSALLFDRSIVSHQNACPIET